MEIGELFRFDDPGNHCFGCSPHNPSGLQLAFTRTGDRTVECRTTVKPDFGGQPGVIHGGVQAALLDEVMGVAVHLAWPEGEDADCVTADFSLRYRRPAPTATELVLVGELDHVDGRNVHVRGEIRDGKGEVLTRGTARWVRIQRDR